MRRVYMVYLARKVANPFSVKVALVLVLLAYLRQYVSIKHVLVNSPSFMNPAEAFNFFGHAFFNTTLAVEAITVGLVVVGVLFLRDAFRRYSLANEYQAIVGKI